MRGADIAITLVLLLLTGSVHSQSPAVPTIRLGDRGSIEAVDFNPDRLPAFHSFSQDDWRSQFPIYTGSTWPKDDRPHLLGRYEVGPNVIRFLPTFPLAPGMSVIARFQPESGPAAQCVLVVPGSTAPAPTVIAVYPTSDVPENLLKLYIHFSQPMRPAGPYDHIYLLDDNGTRVDPPFVEIEPPLWDVDTKRLTLLFEPGRIKRGIRQHTDLGLPLSKDAIFTLVVDTQMRDASGQALGRAHESTFRTVEDDRSSPRTESWQIRVPRAETRHALVLTLDEPLDHALLQSMITIHLEDQIIDGKIVIAQAETEWRFTPEEAWLEGDYELRTNVLLEDLAGNRIDRLFDVDMMVTEEQTMENLGEWVTKRFSIQRTEDRGQ